jgi:hypothetical protein
MLSDATVMAFTDKRDCHPGHYKFKQACSNQGDELLNNQRNKDCSHLNPADVPL